MFVFAPPVFVLASLGLLEAQLRQKDVAKRIIGQELPWMGDCASTWDNAVDTVMRDLGEGFELRRHNKKNVMFRGCRLRHGTSSYVCGTRWIATDIKRIACVV